MRTTPESPDAERKLDSVRKPHQVMAFYGAKLGNRIAGLLTARLYTRILSLLVGPENLVCSATPAPGQELHDRVKRPGMANLRVPDRPCDELALPQDGSRDFVFIHLDYHEVPAHIRAAMNRRAFASLKRGGLSGVVDHLAPAGRGDQVAKTDHRIEKISGSKKRLTRAFDRRKKRTCSCVPTIRVNSA